nr:MAG TPA: hypothetical protein [Caudoviricetes sp.]
MRFLEVLKTIRNKFIRKNPQAQPEGTQKVPEEMKTPEKEKVTEDASSQAHKGEDEKERMIRRYRAYAYCHKKRRTRKKYLKKLFEVSPVDRLLYIMIETGCTAEELANALNKSAEMGLLKKEFGSGKDHMDSRIRGGVR